MSVDNGLTRLYIVICSAIGVLFDYDIVSFGQMLIIIVCSIVMTTTCPAYMPQPTDTKCAKSNHQIKSYKQQYPSQSANDE